MNTQRIIEDAFFITPKDIFQNLKYGKSGDFGTKNRPEISFWLDDPADIFSITLGVDGHEPQTIKLEKVFITFGERAYFVCSCGLRVNKLYLPVNGDSFACRKCHKLQYFLTTFNKNSAAGRQFYKMNRIQKLVATRERMSRVLYNGEYTKRFSRFLQLCNKAGLNEVVDKAQGLMELIRG
ncbi:MAG: hypothetical protein A2427_02350 [Candidatus Nealsonbacteria bacterium RIFOXYC1_FULL_40_7]|uniref:Uncharacterized protein n=1 Tax=Candidatus Nealsonbacteria bacterium RIFOXYC1_FULL_40_7 TaxID=1801678 RepID=A0A1G2ESQ8_9BACT|nr:MAG: hypothetical protein A2427_02350 [Candidatus Nealsonbacteria bacterium RIFOXYC1_FULL_40_7]